MIPISDCKLRLCGTDLTVGHGVTDTDSGGLRVGIVGDLFADVRAVAASPISRLVSASAAAHFTLHKCGLPLPEIAVAVDEKIYRAVALEERKIGVTAEMIYPAVKDAIFDVFSTRVRCNVYNTVVGTVKLACCERIDHFSDEALMALAYADNSSLAAVYAVAADTVSIRVFDRGEDVSRFLADIAVVCRSDAVGMYPYLRGSCNVSILGETVAFSFDRGEALLVT